MKSSLKQVTLLDWVGIAIAFILTGLSIYKVFEIKRQQAQESPPAYLVMDSKQVAVLEVQSSFSEQAKGLAGRSTLLEGEGMLFPISPPRKVKVWMKDVAFPIDIIFLRNNKIVSIVNNAPPCINTRCQLYEPNTLVDAVIELPVGQAQKLHLHAGTAISIKQTQPLSGPKR